MNVPPHNLEAERSVLGGVLIKPAAIDEVVILLETTDFYLPLHRAIYGAMLELVAKRAPIDVLSVGDVLRTRAQTTALEGGEEFLVDLASGCPTAENVVHYAAIVKEKSSLRGLIAACAAATSRAYGDVTADDAIATAQAEIMNLALRRPRVAKPMRQAVAEALDLLERRSMNRGKVLGVPSGIKRLDRRTGGFQAGDLIVVAARTSIGKSALGGQIAVRCAVNHRIPVIVFSVEMTTQQLIERMLANVGKVDYEHLRSGFIELAEWKDIQGVAGRLAEAPIEIRDDTIPLVRICAEARRWRTANPGEKALVVVDYLQLVEIDARKGESREREVARVSAGLKALAKELACPVALLAQLKRETESEERDPRLTDLRESGAIEQDADMILFLTRERMEKEGPAVVIVAKHRNGPTGKAKLHWIGKYQLLEDAIDGDEEETH